MNKYDNDPNYKKEEEGVYRDLTTNEVVIIFDEESSASISKLMNTADHQGELVLDHEVLDILLKDPKWGDNTSS